MYEKLTVESDASVIRERRKKGGGGATIYRPGDQRAKSRKAAPKGKLRRIQENEKQVDAKKVLLESGPGALRGIDRLSRPKP